MAVGNTAASQVVRRDFDGDVISGKDSDAMAPHASRDASEHIMVFVDLDSEIAVTEDFGNVTLQFNGFFFRNGATPFGYFRE